MNREPFQGELHRSQRASMRMSMPKACCPAAKPSRHNELGLDIHGDHSYLTRGGNRADDIGSGKLAIAPRNREPGLVSPACGLFPFQLFRFPLFESGLVSIVSSDPQSTPTTAAVNGFECPNKSVDIGGFAFSEDVPGRSLRDD